MTNLKTLKDIEFNAGVDFMRYHKLRKSDPFVTKADLKQEAIKWGKIMRNIDNKEMRLEFFLRVFNLTEKELK